MFAGKVEETQGKIGVIDPVKTTPLVYYPADHATLGQWDNQS